MNKTPVEICREIVVDMEADARHFDGQPFNGRTVAEYLAHQGAALAALANILAMMGERYWSAAKTMTLDQPEETHASTAPR